MMNSDAHIHGGLLRPNFKRRLPYRLFDQAKYPGLYLDPNSDPKQPTFFERPYVNRRQTFRALRSITPRAAHQELCANRNAQQKSRAGLAVDPYTKPRHQILTVAALLTRYADAGFPKKRNRSSPRSPRDLLDQKARVANLAEFFGRKNPAELTGEDLLHYHSWKIRKIKQREPAGTRPGHRSVDIDRVVLSGAFDHAIDHARQTGIKANPFARRIKRFADPSTVKHCRDFQPDNADELHRLASILLQSWASQALAWQLLFEAMIGQRSHEILRLRMDAKTQYEPGFIQKKFLFLYRSNTSKGTYPYTEIHPALRQCLDAHRAWHQQHYPGNRWYFPSPKKNKQPLGAGALTHSLRRVTAELGLPKRTSHGLRSYYVNVLRTDRRADGTHRYTDAEIALRIGQRTQGKLIVDVYGEIPPHQLTWLPETALPAWAPWLPGAAIPAEQLTLEL